LGTDKELLKYFYVVRSEALFKGKNIEALEDVYYKYDGNRIVNALSIDRRNNLDSLSIQRAITRVANKKEVLMLYAHEPNTTFDVSSLMYILKKAADQNVKFIRISDLVK
jgi:hypothetical protein